MRFKKIILKIAILHATTALVMVLTSCSDSEQYKESFIEKVNSQLTINSSIEIKFSEYFKFKWDEVCFGTGPNLEAKFYFKKKLKLGVMYKKQFYIREDYVHKSPSGRCLKNSQEYLLIKKRYNKKERILIEIIIKE